MALVVVVDIEAVEIAVAVADTVAGMVGFVLDRNASAVRNFAFVVSQPRMLVDLVHILKKQEALVQEVLHLSQYLAVPFHDLSLLFLILLLFFVLHSIINKQNEQLWISTKAKEMAASILSCAHTFLCNRLLSSSS